MIKKIKQSRAKSFLVIALVYLVASAVGVAVYLSLELGIWLSLLVADVAATVVTFAFSIIFKNASVYDPYWSVQPPVILIGFALGHGLNLFGVMLSFAVCVWGARLTANWAYTFGDLEHQDWRYTMLCERTGAFYPVINFLGIHLVPTLVVYGCILPAVYAVTEGLDVTPLSVVFVCLSLCAATLQGVSDAQMHKFRRSRTGGFIRTGLWRYSRHPNYLGEILMWWGVALSVVAAQPSAWYLCAGALSNTALFLAVSIPMADRRQSRKEGFEEYRAQTRMLLPIKK